MPDVADGGDGGEEDESGGHQLRRVCGVQLGGIVLGCSGEGGGMLCSGVLGGEGFGDGSV